MELTKEYLHERFTYLDGELYWKTVFSNRLKVGQRAGDCDGRGYRRVMIGNKHYKMHILIWIMFNGPIPDGAIVDHQDTNRLNCRIENLRLLTKAGNNRNQNAGGITFDKSRNKWRAQASVGNQTVMLGRFDTEEEARQEYQNFVSFMLSEGGEALATLPEQ